MLRELLDHLWQSTAFASVAAVLALALRRHHARTRHRFWLAASLKFLLPFTLLTALGTQVGSHAPLRLIATPKIAAQFEVVVVEWGTPPGLLAHSNVLPNAAQVLWLAGILLLAIRWTAAWLRIRIMVCSAEPLALPFPIPVRSTSASIEPGVFGIFRPVLLLPSGIAEHLLPAQFQAILAHELAHVRRRDNLWSALHMVVEALFWFHPLVWWIGARLADERERACDEAVLCSGNHAEVYAESILAACKLYLESPLPCVSRITGADLKKRLERIMTGRLTRGLTTPTKIAIAAAATIVLLLPFAAGLIHAQSPGPAFDVASVKPLKPGSAPENRVIAAAHGSLTVHQKSLHDLIAWAYSLEAYNAHIEGPSWIDSEDYEISAKAGPGTTNDQLRLMLRTLLADRFHLSLHRKTEERPSYSLTVAHTGLRMDAVQQEPVRPIRIAKDANFVGFTFTSTIARFVEFLPAVVDRPVRDATGLTGVYAFTLKVELDPEIQMPEVGMPFYGFHVSQAAANAGLERLGLQLVAGRGPVEILAIDHVERPTKD
jgi:uncharacterized protein (TIGR03435 family)